VKLATAGKGHERRLRSARRLKGAARWCPLSSGRGAVPQAALDGRRQTIAGAVAAVDVVTSRLNRLCEEGLLERVQYQDRPARHEYRVTQKGIDYGPSSWVL